MTPPYYVSKVDLANSPGSFTFNGTKVYLHAPRDQDGSTKPLSAMGNFVEQDQVAGRQPWVSHKEPAPAGVTGEVAANFLSKRQVRIDPIQRDEVFTFTIRFDNLSEAELSALCAAITPSEHFEHRVGMGKPLGLGSVKLSIQSLKVVDRLARYGLDPEGSNPVSLDAVAFARQGMRALRESNASLFAALLRYGEPRYVQLPVHYPQLSSGYQTAPAVPGNGNRRGRDATLSQGHLEVNAYEWWMANDRPRGGKQFINQ